MCGIDVPNYRLDNVYHILRIEILGEQEKQGSGQYKDCHRTDKELRECFMQKTFHDSIAHLYPVP